MHKVIPGRPATALAFFTALLLTVATSALFFADSAIAAPRAQTELPDFTLGADTILTVTVAVTGGQVIVVPIDLSFVAESNDGETDMSLIAEVEQQAGIFIGVAPITNISATIQLPGVEPVTTGAPPATNSGNGTHVANTNSRLRSGPGTNFEIVGRVPQGTVVTVVGQNDDGSWLQLDNGAWMAEFLLDPLENNGNNGDTGNTENQNNNENNNNENNSGNDGNNPEDDTENDGANDGVNDNQANSGDDAEAETELVSVPVETPATPGDQSAFANYLVDLAIIGAEASSAANTLNVLIQNSNPVEATWQNDIATQLGALSGALDQYLALTPVPGYEALHAQVTDVALTCEQAVDYLAGALTDPSAIDPAFATESVQACAAQATNLVAEVETLQ